MRVECYGDITPCSVCNAEFPYTSEYFRKRSELRFGLQRVCNFCTKILSKQRNQRYKDKFEIVVETKYCPGCKQVLPRDRFVIDRMRKDGLLSICISCKTIKNRERSQKIKIAGSHSSLQEQVLWEEVGKLCWACLRVCLERFNPARGVGWGWTIDHIVPISKNGSNDIENIQILCNSCNSLKNHRNDWNFSKGKEYAYAKAKAVSTR